MPNSAVIHRVFGVGIFVLTLGVYVKTLAPTVSFWDCGEFIATSYILGVPHPPGAPLYVLLGRVFTLFPFGEVAIRVNFMSALTSALAIWCVYLSTVALGRRALGGQPLQPLGDARDIGVLAGGAVAALTLAFSYTQWYNASEAEVYGYSILFTCLGLWLILYWEGSGAGAANDRWLLALAYLFGLGGGVHLLCLLTIPSLMLLAWFADRQLQRLIVLLVGWGVVSGLGLVALESEAQSNGVMVLGLAGLLAYLHGRDRRLFVLLLGVLVLFALGYSTYGALYIRSGLNPAIDENDPETWAAFLKFLNREQYGTESMLTTMLTARASRSYQFWDQQMKYFFQQFPFPLLERVGEFRKATINIPDRVSISLVPYGLGLWGLLWHGRQDWRRFGGVLLLFLIMGFGLSLYLNMPDPQPRERHYVFGGMYLAFALWIGLGWLGVVEAVRQQWGRHRAAVVTVAAAGLLLPAGVAARLYHVEDRTGDFIAYDYAHNMLTSCEEGSILFTNGDNDTFPLWFLQEVEGVRRDVRVVNLSLLNTGWYIKQLRDREPRINIRYTDDFIDSVLTDTQMVDFYKRYWPEPKVPPELKKLGIDVEVSVPPEYPILRVQDVMVIKILAWNEWKKPIHFAITVPTSNLLNLDPYLTMVGMSVKVSPEPTDGVDDEALERNLLEKYRFRGLNDPSLYKDENSERLLGNYWACVLQLARSYEEQGRRAEVPQLMQWARDNIYISWESHYGAADYFSTLGQHDIAIEHIYEAARFLIERVGIEPAATYDNIIALTGVLIQEPYSAYDRAEGLYHQAIALAPERWEGYYELAAALQAKGDVPGALAVLQQYKEQYGERPELVEAERILRQPTAP